MELLKEITAKIKPKDDSELKKEIKKIVGSINAQLKKNKVKAVASVGGSFAKDTHLVDDHDCDIFVQFDYKYKESNISDLLEKALKQFKPTRLHGSRDYFQFSNALNYEIVPVIKITKPSQALNVTDVSPLHVAWVRKHKKSDEIRLAKAFCKAQGIYGAESYIKGFSGHVLDILTIHYGSFMNLLKASQKWKDKTVIDVEEYYKNAKDALFELNTSKTQSPLIIIDPLQKERNAAAALGDEQFDLFIKHAKAFLKRPSATFFEKKTINKKDIKDAIIVEITPLKGKRDIVGAKILKVHDAIKRSLEQEDFEVKDSGWVWGNETFVWFKLKKDKLESETIVRGPPVAMKSHVEAFKKKHKRIFLKNNVCYAKIKREYTDARQVIKEVIKSDEVKERVRSITIWS